MPTVAVAGPVLATVSFGALIVVSTGGLVHGPGVQPGSPPPLAFAVFVTLAPALDVGVTFTVNVTALPAPVPMPEAIVHVTSWPATVHVGLPGVTELIVNPFGTVSVTVVAAVVAAVPVFVTCSV